jgi:hypothetical protein
VLILVGCAILGLFPIIMYLLKQAKTSTPSLQWPALAGVLKFQYQSQPPRMLGDWEGRHAGAELHNGKVLVTLQLSQPSRLRVEVGPKAEMEARAGMVMPDRVATGDLEFDARLLARCSERAAAQSIFEATLRQRLMAQPNVEMIGVGDKVQWILPDLKDCETLEHVLEVMTAIASEMERFPANA